MTQQTLAPSPRLALVRKITFAAPGLGPQPLFYYDGAYLTWRQLVRQLRPNTATAAQVARPHQIQAQAAL